MLHISIPNMPRKSTHKVHSSQAPPAGNNTPLNKDDVLGSMLKWHEAKPKGNAVLDPCGLPCRTFAYNYQFILVVKRHTLEHDYPFTLVDNRKLKGPKAAWLFGCNPGIGVAPKRKTTHWSLKTMNASLHFNASHLRHNKLCHNAHHIICIIMVK